MNINLYDTLLSVLKGDSPVENADSDQETVQQESVWARYRLRGKMSIDKSSKNKAETMVDALNGVLKDLQDYFPSVKVVQWGGVDSNSDLAKVKGLKKIPTDSLKKAEDYVHKFSHKFESSELYYRIQIVIKKSEASDSHLAATLERSFQRKESIFNATTGRDNNIQREFLEIAASDAIDPETVGFFVNHQYEIFSSKAWKDMVKMAVGDPSMGFIHKPVYVPKAMQDTLPKTKFWSHKNVIQVETDWKNYMKNNINLKLKNLFKYPILGCLMDYVELPKKWTESIHASEEVMDGLRCQITLQTNLKCTVQMNTKMLVKIRGVTLLQKLMEIDSVTEKDDSGKPWHGKLFHSITPIDGQTWRVCYIPPNEKEATAVMEALPRFIRREYKRCPKNFCGSDLITYAESGEYSHSKRTFVSQESKSRSTKYENMMKGCIIEMETKPETIPKSVKNAMARNLDDKTVEKVKNDGEEASMVSSITGGTVNTITLAATLNNERKVHKEELEALQAQIKQMQASMDGNKALPEQPKAVTPNKPDNSSQEGATEAEDDQYSPPKDIPTSPPTNKRLGPEYYPQESSESEEDDNLIEGKEDIDSHKFDEKETYGGKVIFNNLEELKNLTNNHEKQEEEESSSSSSLSTSSSSSEDSSTHIIPAKKVIKKEEDVNEENMEDMTDQDMTMNSKKRSVTQRSPKRHESGQRRSPRTKTSMKVPSGGKTSGGEKK